MPHVVTFSTGATLPTASVSGTISFPGGDPTGTIVGLFENSIGDENPGALVIVQSATGTFTLDYVPAGIYLPVALKDMNKSGEFDPEPGIDVLGIYDPSSTGFINPLVVLDGAPVTGVDMTLEEMNFITAREQYVKANTAALLWNVDAVPIMLAAFEMDSSGKAGFWTYLFHSSNASDYFGLIASSVFIAPFSDLEMMPDTNIALPTDWIDSDEAADSAEVYGGLDFRTENPDAEIGAFLTYMDLEGGFPGFGKAAFLPKLQIIPGANNGEKKGSTKFLKSKRSQEVQALWGFQYYSDENYDRREIFLDALTGEFVGPVIPDPSTAEFNLAASDSAANIWANDAELIIVGVHMQMGGLNADGKTMYWYFAYYSANLDAEQMYFMAGGQVMGQDTLGWDPPSRTPLPLLWIDSDTAMSIAERNGGSDYRALNQDVWVSGGLSRGMYYSDHDLAVWKIDYGVPNSPPALTIFIDAVTKEVLGVASETPTTARHNLATANQSASAWALDAELMGVGVAGEDLTLMGEAMTWMFWYYSTSLDTGWMVMINDNNILSQEEPDNWHPPIMTALPADWIDSDSAMGIAESNGGGQFRADNQHNVEVGGGVTRGLLMEQPSRAVWALNYNTETDTIEIYIDAATAEFIKIVVSDVESQLKLSAVPESFVLNQNYPNPFNPETVIKYQLPHDSNVEITIFNLHGQRVITLVMEDKNAGFHNIKWNGTDQFGQPAASGIYLYKIKAENFISVKKMLLVR